MKEDEQAIAIVLAVFRDERSTEQALRRASDGETHQLLPVVQVVDGDDVDLFVFGADGEGRAAEHALRQEAQRRDALAKQVLCHQAQRVTFGGKELHLAGRGTDGWELAAFVERAAAGRLELAPEGSPGLRRVMREVVTCSEPLRLALTESSSLGRAWARTWPSMTSTESTRFRPRSLVGGTRSTRASRPVGSTS